MIVGIDLGTTNSACAVFRNGEVEMIPNSLGDLLTPSAVSLDEDNNVITGLAARERQSTHPDHTVTAFKRFMGTNHVTKLGKREFSPIELSALMLQRLKADAEAYLGEPVDEVVITVPAYFNDKQRKATRHAGQMAGLKVERLINEPTAAALAYGIHQRDAETKFLVFDLGGGTFDVSILEIFEGIIEVRATAGDNRLGGEDFNEAIIKVAKRKLSETLSIWGKTDPTLYQKLREAAERCRRALSENEHAEFSVVWNDEALKTTISTEEFEDECASLITRLREPVLRSIKDSSLSINALSEVIMVGGSTRMPLIRKTVTKMFGRFPSHAIDPDMAVAQGAAVQAALKARDSDLKDVVLTDVCPYSLGVEVHERTGSGLANEGTFSPILERNCIVPASRQEVYGTLVDNQTALNFRIFQGESHWVKDNVFLGELNVDIPRAKAGEVPIECRFSYDINGLLEIDVHVPKTGRRFQKVIVDRDNLSEKEIETQRKALAKLKVHPRDTDANRTIIARAGRCYENSIGDERTYLGQQISAYEAVLEQQDLRMIEQAREQLSKILDQFEGETFL